MSKSIGNSNSKLPTTIREGYKAQVYEMLLIGCYRRDIVQFAFKNDWGISAKAVDEYIRKAKKELAFDIKKQERDSLEKFIKSAWHLYSRAYAKSDYALCHAIRQDMQKLQDKYPTEKKEFDIESESLAGWLSKVSSNGNGSKPIQEKN